MKKLINILLLTLLLPLVTFCQVEKERDVVASAGDYSTTASMEVSWTVGEPAVISTETASLIVSEGFQQADVNLIGIEDAYEPELFMVYPNPVSDVLNFEIESKETMELRGEVYDMMGRCVNTVPLFRVNAAYSGQIDFSQLPAGKWFLQFSSPSGKFVKTCTVTKIR